MTALLRKHCLLRGQDREERARSGCHRWLSRDTVFSTATHPMNGSYTHSLGLSRWTCYSHVVEPVTHGRAWSAWVGPRVSRSPGVRAAHHGAPHAWFVHPGFWSMGLNGGTACTHGLTFTLPLTPSHKHGLPESSACDVTRSVQEAGGCWG